MFSFRWSFLTLGVLSINQKSCKLVVEEIMRFLITVKTHHEHDIVPKTECHPMTAP
jgi:hypothetical protein